MKTLRWVLLVFMLLGCTPAGGNSPTAHETAAQAYIWARRVCTALVAAEPYAPRPASSGGGMLAIDGGVP